MANAQRRRRTLQYTREKTGESALKFELVAVVECNVNFVMQGADALADIVLGIRFDGFVLEQIVCQIQGGHDGNSVGTHNLAGIPDFLHFFGEEFG